jgi:hypothetical protein
MSEILDIPNAWKAGIITTKGLGLLSKLVHGNTLAITRAETGAGFVAEELLASQLAVTDPVQALSFSAVSYPEEGKCMIPCKLTNEEVETSYIARQIGLYAMEPDEGEILFYITQVEDEDGGTGIPAAKLIPSYSATWNLVIYYGMADGVDVTVDPAGAVTMEEVEQLIKGYSASVGSAIMERITVPATGWTELAEEDQEDGYLYTTDVVAEKAKEHHFPILALDIASLSVAANAEVCPTIDALDGIVRFWAKAIPAADLTGTLMLRSENLIEPNIADLMYTLQPATTTVLGGIKGSDTIVIDADGTAHAVGAAGGEVATDEEVAEAIEELFGPKEEEPEPEPDDGSGPDIATDEEVKDAVDDIFG